MTTTSRRTGCRCPIPRTIKLMAAATQRSDLACDAQRRSMQRLVPHHGRTHLDLFSGIGGFALAAASAGFKTIGFSEIEPYACKVLNQNWPDVSNYGDIRNVRGVRADLLTGGFPCQPFSVAGKRLGKEDDRHLWPEMCRVIAETRPTWVLGENVPGIIGMELDRVLSDLENLGYACWPLVIPACGLDARHRRNRLWVVANAVSVRELQPQGCEREQRGRTGNSRAPLADANETGRGEQRKAKSVASEHAAAECGGENVGDSKSEQTERIQQRPFPANAGAASHRAGEAACWPTEPAVGRVANGIPNRSHRLKGLGNAIVPQVAAEILKSLVMGNVQDQATRGA